MVNGGRGEKNSTTRFEKWIAALEARHFANLTPSEVARALRALSSCYVERRGRLAHGAALDSAGKRAAFALFYAPVHFLIIQHIVLELPGDWTRIAHVQDLGCGTGAAGAAWALETAGARVSGVDRHPWAVAEANWTYAQLGIRGRARRLDVARAPVAPHPGTGIIAAYTINELHDAIRRDMLDRLLVAASRGSSVLIVEPIARRQVPWWPIWAQAFCAAGGRADEWRWPAALPDRQRVLAKAAGLRPRDLTARSLFLAPAT